MPDAWEMLYKKVWNEWFDTLPKEADYTEEQWDEWVEGDTPDYALLREHKVWESVLSMMKEISQQIKKQEK